MSRATLVALTLALAAAMPLSARAQVAADRNAADTAASAATSLRQSLMEHVLVMRGELDGQRIQLTLEPKKNEDGLKGRYFVFGESTEILLAGEVDGDDLVMEESRNGRDVSGQWEGHRQGAVIVGTWSNADGSVTRPFSLQLP
ncbi:hypothetical protein [Herbaspirillum sp. alder98]|uniref:hypothetical protein n=1 Tax=Herbaspirillum sp. alder98 TaxID=2913096 RepID=UPI001CD82084|nr:hypothetical protein [Herbaspirillum sp. alder98]MCA1325941.1 hypothetical protein [Herbaspirillum sp. alder98]